MALVVYQFTQDVGANHAGDRVELDQESAQALLDAGLIEEATEQAEEPAEEAGDPLAEAAITRSIREGLKEVKEAVLKANSLTKAVEVGNFATVRTPAVKSMGDLLRCEFRAKQGDTVSRNKLKSYHDDLRVKTPAGMSLTAADGGYAVPQNWADELFSKVKNLPKLLEMTNRQTISGNTLNIPAVNETSLVDGSRGGGILAYYQTEGSAVTTSYPALTNVQAVLKTLMVIVPITNQLLADNAYNLDAFIQEKVGEEFVWQENDAVINGPGTTEPKGLLAQASKITVSKESGQSAATVVFPNLAKMFARLYAPSRANAVWLINPMVYQQLIQMTFPNASATYPAFGFVTWNAHEEFPLRIFGKPAIECLMCPDLGVAGDIILCDLKQLTTAEHPGLEVAMSDQVYFTSAQTLFRFMRRFDIQSPWTGTLTDANNHYTFSPIVVLETRGT